MFSNIHTSGASQTTIFVPSSHRALACLTRNAGFGAKSVSLKRNSQLSRRISKNSVSADSVSVLLVRESTSCISWSLSLANTAGPTFFGAMLTVFAILASIARVASGASRKGSVRCDERGNPMPELEWKHQSSLLPEPERGKTQHWVRKRCSKLETLVCGKHHTGAFPVSFFQNRHTRRILQEESYASNC